jgi:WD40 repeat protein
MLDTIPLEILEIILGHLPTAKSVINLSLGNRKLHKQISADKYALLRSFVQARFPSIETPPFWRDAAIALTARSRAWDRRAFVARECSLPGEVEVLEAGNRIPNGLKTGFVPAIDSYEAWTGSTWAEKKEVVAWGAAGRLSVRITQNGKASSSVYRTPLDHLPTNDIMEVRLLTPHQNADLSGETMILRRANDNIVKIVSKGKKDTFEQISTFALGPKSQPLEGMDVNSSAEPLIAACSATEIRLYHAGSEKHKTEAFDVLGLEGRHDQKHRIRSTKFLSPTRLALGVQFLEGKGRAPIEIYEVCPSGISEKPTHIRDETIKAIAGRHCANVVVPLDATSSLAGQPGDVFLSGWTDGVVRLFDLRSNRTPSLEYYDTVDDGQILSLLAIGHEKILAGSHQNACLKTWDLRMTGGRVYSYAGSIPSVHDTRPKNQKTSSPRQPYSTQRDMNIFLALHIPRARRLWESLPPRPDPRVPRYRGAVYSLSSPSPSSTTVYAGIENHVIQLDFISTDDVRNARMNDLGLGLPDGTNRTRPILDLSCYERPQPGYEIFDPILLRKQVDVPGSWSFRTKPQRDGSNFDQRAEAGWDERWRLSTYDRGEPSLAWR